MQKLQQLKKLKKDQFYEFSQNIFKDYEVLVVSCGPSAKYLTELIDTINNPDLVIIAVKQSIKLLENYHIHIFNSANCQNYKNASHNSLKIYGSSGSLELNKSVFGIQFNDFDHKIVVNDYNISLSESLCQQVDPKELLLSNDLFSCWGPGVMHEIVIPLTLHFGFSNIHIIGWDLPFSRSNSAHFYEKKLKHITLAPLIYKALRNIFFASPLFSRRLLNLLNKCFHLLGLRYNLSSSIKGESQALYSSLVNLMSVYKDQDSRLNIWSLQEHQNKLTNLSNQLEA